MSQQVTSFLNAALNGINKYSKDETVLAVAQIQAICAVAAAIDNLAGKVGENIPNSIIGLAKVLNQRL